MDSLFWFLDAVRCTSVGCESRVTLDLLVAGRSATSGMLEKR